MHIHTELIFSLDSKDLLDVKYDGIERRVKASMITRVGNHAVDIRDDSSLPPDIHGGPRVPQRILLLDRHPIAYFERVSLVAHGANSQ